jgi:heme oxygenase
LTVILWYSEESGGAILVGSEPDKGLTFNLFVPRLDAHVRPEREGKDTAGADSQK